MPAGAVNIVFVIITSVAAAYLKKSRCIIMMASSCVSLLGWALVGFLPSANEGGRLFGVYIFSVYAAGFPISLSLISSNVAGFTKKTVVSGVVFLGYCAGNIGGPQGFISSESPTYPVSSRFLFREEHTLIILLDGYAHVNWRSSSINSCGFCFATIHGLGE